MQNHKTGMGVNRSTWSATLAVAVAAALGAPALGASGTWNGSTSSDWDDPANWTTGMPNASGEVATFNADVPFDNPTLDANITIGTLTIGGTAPATTISSAANKLVLAGGFNAMNITNGHANILDLDVDFTYTGSVYNVGPTSSMTLATGNTLTLSPASNLYYQIAQGGTMTINSAINNTGPGNRGFNVVNGTLNFNPDSLSGTAFRIGPKSNGNGTVAYLNLHQSLLATKITSIEIGDNSPNIDSISTVRLSQNNLTIASPISIIGAGTGVTGTRSHTVELNLLGTNVGSFTGNLTANPSTGTATDTFSVGADDTLTFSGVVNYNSGAGTPNYVVQKTGDGILIFAGTTANDFYANTTFAVTDGTLRLAKTAGLAAIDNNLSVSSGATVQLGAANQITDASAITLLGGEFDANGLSETLGALTINGSSSIIDFGTGTSTVQFASGTYTAGSLTIENWNSATDDWLFSSDPTSFVSALGSNLTFAGYAGTGGTVTDLGGGMWEVTPAPVPEPAGAVLLLAGAASALTMRRRRR